MQARAAVIVSTSILVAASVLTLTFLWNEFPALEPTFVSECVKINAPADTPFEPACAIIHTYRPMPILEVVVKMAVFTAVLLGVAALVARIVPARSMLAGSLSSMSSAIASLVALQVIFASTQGGSYVPHIVAVALFALPALIVGAAGSWVAGRWWPNISLERTPDR